MLRIGCVLLLGGALHGSAIAAPAVPDDVGAFRAQREQCDHFRGEDSDDPKRRTFLQEKLRQYCTGTDARLRQLKEKYRTSPSIVEILNGYEPQIE